MCGAVLKERKRREFGPAAGDLLLPILLVVVVAVLWVWKPWQVLATRGAGVARVTATATVPAVPSPTATRTVAPTATPLDTPTPLPTPTLPPDQTVHTVASGETVISIAKAYGTTASAILKANNLKATTIIKPGAKLIIPLPKALLPTQTPTPVPSPTPLIYVVKTGDTLSTIATKFGTTTAALMKANNITDATRLHAGARLRIVRADELPVEPTVSPSKTYVVKEGDTLYDIATQFKVSVSDLKRANGLKNNTLHIGQKLTIPGGPAGSAQPPTPTLTPQPTLEPTATPAAVLAMTSTLTETTTLVSVPVTDTAVTLVWSTSTPVPGQEGEPADLLSPANGATFEGSSAAIRLVWASVGILDDDEWYVIRLRRGEADEKWDESANRNVHLYWTKATSFRVPAALYVQAGGAAQRWQWRVLVMRHTGTDKNGNWIGEEIRPSSANRAFYWK
jgi:LysM repeat protein